MTDRKTAEAEQKRAQKAWESASKKATTSREKYLADQGAANAAARELDWANANPALFEDDPLRIVVPGGPNAEVPAVTGATVKATQGTLQVQPTGEGSVLTMSPPSFTGDFTVKVADGVGHDGRPVPLAPAPSVQDVTFDSPITVAGVPAEERAGGDVVEPWEQPVAEPAAPVEAPRRRAARKPREVKPEAPAAEVAPWAQPVPEAPAAPAPSTPQAPPGQTFAGYDASQRPVFQPATPQAPPWETGQAMDY